MTLAQRLRDALSSNPSAAPLEGTRRPTLYTQPSARRLRSGPICVTNSALESTARREHAP